MTTPTGLLPWYCSRGEVKLALDYKESAIADARIDRAIEDASREIDRVLARNFYPYWDTRYFDWPTHQYATPWRVWLDKNEVCALPTEITNSNGTETIPSSDYFMRPDDALQRGMPFTLIEINLGSQSAFNSGVSYQRSVAITGVFGYSMATDPAGLMLASMASSDTTAHIPNSALVDVGTVMIIDSEYMIVTDANPIATAGTLAGNLDAQSYTNAIPVSTGMGTTYAKLEVITIDGEDMLIVKIVGDSLHVRRAWNGTPLASHTSGASIYANRLVSVARGCVGTSAAIHNNAAPVSVHHVPGKIKELCIAEAGTRTLGESSGYAQQYGEAGATTKLGAGLPDLWVGAMASYGRQIRKRTTSRLI